MIRIVWPHNWTICDTARHVLDWSPLKQKKCHFSHEWLRSCLLAILEQTMEWSFLKTNTAVPFWWSNVTRDSSSSFTHFVNLPCENCKHRLFEAKFWPLTFLVLLCYAWINNVIMLNNHVRDDNTGWKFWFAMKFTDMVLKTGAENMHKPQIDCLESQLNGWWVHLGVIRWFIGKFSLTRNG